MVEKWRSASEEDTERGRRLLDWPEETLFANCPCKLHAYGNICLVDALPLTNWARGCVSSLFGQRERCFVKKSYWAIKKIERSACRWNLEDLVGSLSPQDSYFDGGHLANSDTSMTWWMHGRSRFLWIPLCEYFYYVDSFVLFSLILATS